MKKILIAVLLITGFVGFNHFEHHYTRKDCKVVSVKNNVVTVEDKCGYWWSFEGTDYEKGDKVNLKMFDNCTDSYVEDDEIVKVVRQ